VTTIRTPHRRTPAAARRRPLRRVLPLLLLGAALAGTAQAQDWSIDGNLVAGDLRWHRPYLAGATCLLSSIGTDVRYDVHELYLDDPAAPADLIANLCEVTEFDSVLYLYQRPSGAPGGFDPEAPCTRLLRYNDDYCGAQSRIGHLGLVPGYVTLVVTSFANGVTGPYRLSTFSDGSPLQDLVFYSGFETGTVRTWSRGFL
jgi:hypothetical protein